MRSRHPSSNDCCHHGLMSDDSPSHEATDIFRLWTYFLLCLWICVTRWKKLIDILVADFYKVLFEIQSTPEYTFYYLLFVKYCNVMTLSCDFKDNDA